MARIDTVTTLSHNQQTNCRWIKEKRKKKTLNKEYRIGFTRLINISLFDYIKLGLKINAKNLRIGVEK